MDVCSAQQVLEPHSIGSVRLPPACAVALASAPSAGLVPHQQSAMSASTAAMNTHIVVVQLPGSEESDGACLWPGSSSTSSRRAA